MFHVPLFDCPKLRSQRCWGVPRKILKLNVLFGCLFFFPTTPPTLSPPSSLAPPSFLLYLLKCSRTLTAIWEEKLAKVTPLLLSLTLYQYVVDLPNTLEVTKRILFNRNYVLGVSIMANLYFGVVGGLLVVLRNIKTVDFLATFLKNNLNRKRSILTQRISLSWQNLSRLLTNLCINSCPCFHFIPN